MNVSELYLLVDDDVHVPLKLDLIPLQYLFSLILESSYVYLCIKYLMGQLNK